MRVLLPVPKSTVSPDTSSHIIVARPSRDSVDAATRNHVIVAVGCLNRVVIRSADDDAMSPLRRDRIPALESHDALALLRRLKCVVG